MNKQNSSNKTIAGLEVEQEAIQREYDAMVGSERDEVISHCEQAWELGLHVEEVKF